MKHRVNTCRIANLVIWALSHVNPMQAALASSGPHAVYGLVYAHSEMWCGIDDLGWMHFAWSKSKVVSKQPCRRYLLKTLGTSR